MAAVWAVTVAVLVPLTACAPRGDAGPTPSVTTTLPQGGEHVDLDPEALSADITNPWFPLTTGRRWTYRETTEDGIEQTVVVTATSQTRRIADGVTARVVRDTVSRGDEVVEDTFDWYAQDAAGNVWYLGEDTAELEHGAVATRAGSFEAGVDGAQAGVLMPAAPQVGMVYREEHYAGEAEDRGEVLALDGTASVPAGSYDGLVVIADTTPLEPDVLEHKYYASGTGPVLTIDVTGEGREELLTVESVGPDEARVAGTAPLGSAY